MQIRLQVLELLMPAGQVLPVQVLVVGQELVRRLGVVSLKR
jgi:hypothetical protein